MGLPRYIAAAHTIYVSKLIIIKMFINVQNIINIHSRQVHIVYPYVYKIYMIFIYEVIINFRNHITKGISLKHLTHIPIYKYCIMVLNTHTHKFSSIFTAQSHISLVL